MKEFFAKAKEYVPKLVSSCASTFGFSVFGFCAFIECTCSYGPRSY
jgi:hypothetical protein